MPEQNDLDQEIAAQRAIRNSSAWEDVRNRTGLEEEYLGASNGIAGAKRPLAPEDRQYPEHDKLIEHIMDLVPATSKRVATVCTPGRCWTTS